MKRKTGAPRVALTAEEYAKKRARQISFYFLLMVTAALAIMTPIFWFVLNLSVSAIGTGSVMVISLAGFILVARGKPKLGLSIFLAVGTVALVGVSIISSSSDQFASIMISIVGLSAVVVFPSGALVSVTFTLVATAVIAIGVSVSFAISGDPILMARVPVIFFVYLLMGGMTAVLARMQEGVLKFAMDDGRRARESLAELTDVLDRVSELRKSVDSSQEAYAKSFEQIGAILGTFSETTERLFSTAERVSKEISGIQNQFDSLMSGVDVIVSDTDRQSTVVHESYEQQQSLLTGIHTVRDKIRTAEELNRELQSAATTGTSNMTRASEFMVDLQQRQEEMLEVNKVITKIAAQTNLLAMNASIEAAHAGDAGRGFAVVADEVRNLSDSSNTRTRETNELIRKMADQIAEAVAVVQQTGRALSDMAKKIDATAPLTQQIHEQMEETAGSFEEVLGVLESSSKTMGEVSGRTTEQRSAFQQFQQAFAGYSEYLRELSTGIEAIRTQSNQVRGIVDQLTVIRKQNEDIGQQIAALISSSSHLIAGEPAEESLEPVSTGLEDSPSTA